MPLLGQGAVGLVASPGSPVEIISDEDLQQQFLHRQAAMSEEKAAVAGRQSELRSILGMMSPEELGAPKAAGSVGGESSLDFVTPSQFYGASAGP